MKNLSHRGRRFYRLVWVGWAFSLVFLIAVGIAKGAEFSVSPMLIEMEQKPNSKKGFSFSVHAKKRGKIKLTPYGMVQKETGHMEFFQSRPGQRKSNTAYLVLQKNSITVTAKRPALIKGKVILPRRVRGTHLFAVMVEEDSSTLDKKGIRINVRYAVVIKVNVKGRKIRERGKMRPLALKRDKKGLLISGLLINDSLQDYRVLAEVQVRDKDNQLLERIHLKSFASWKNGEKTSRIFPGAKVLLLGRITKITQPGVYSLFAVSRLGKRGQIVTRQKIHVTPAMLVNIPKVSRGSLAKVTYSPETLKLTARADGSALTFLLFHNPSGHKVEVNFPANERNRAGAYTFFPKTMTLRKGGKKRVLLKQQLSGLKAGMSLSYSIEVVTDGGKSYRLNIPAIVQSRSRKKTGQNETRRVVLR